MRTRSLCAWTWALIIMALIGCGASQRETTLKATFVTVNGLRNGFVAFDKDAQRKVVEAAKTPEGGAAALVAYRAQREKVLGLFDDVYWALSLAIGTQDPASIALAASLAAQLKQTYDDLQKAGHP